MSRMNDEGGKYLLAICASDSRGGAGLQAALAQAALYELECRSVVTAITAQSQSGVGSVTVLPVDVIEAQLDAALQDGQPAVVLLGWLPPQREIIAAVSNFLKRTQAPVVWDPVISATLGKLPGERDTVVALYRELLPQITLITPNLSEALALSGREDSDDPDAAKVARELQGAGVHTVIISGGDLASEGWASDIVVSQPESSQPETMALPEFAIHQKRLRCGAHGTGSQQAAGIAVSLALGYRLYDAILAGTASAHAALSASQSEAGSRYPNCLAVTRSNDGRDWPLITEIDRLPPDIAFERYSPGLYALTDNLEHLQSLLQLNVDTIQWRVKTPGPTYEDDTLEAMRLCQTAGVRFWLNDDWRFALSLCWSLDSSLRPDGVHLGQEDLLSADVEALYEAGLSVGISTHTEWEIARARAFNPGYIAFGPVFPPLSKQLRYSPLGTDQLAEWSERYHYWAQTCIGGIVPANAKAVSATGIESMAVVTCLQPGPEQAANALVLRNALLNA